MITTYTLNGDQGEDFSREDFERMLRNTDHSNDDNYDNKIKLYSINLLTRDKYLHKN